LRRQAGKGDNASNKHPACNPLANPATISRLVVISYGTYSENQLGRAAAKKALVFVVVARQSLKLPITAHHLFV
jgi:hypothetical protein